MPISPLIAEMVTSRTCASCSDRTSTITNIRHAAARQHLDHLLIHEIGAPSAERDTPFALADVTLIGGALLPTRKIKVAKAPVPKIEAMLIDLCGALGK